MRWIVSRFFLFVINFVAANDRCRAEVNIPGMALTGFVFKKMTVTAPHMCDVKCERAITCQSYNYVRKENLCELNNRTKEARPENFLSDPARFYIRRLNGRGMCSVKCKAYSMPFWGFLPSLGFNLFIVYETSFFTRCLYIVIRAYVVLF